ncbi:hypothetical protein QYS48_28500 [Marivirga arenosa]|uniref:Uncharacterized protein n=1 Tax=Marivirga arenosa TaxID=3059076 RepID=A0AA51RD37_9BACT|nr:hypothetical protein [Marivirga sp. ABR2-2]WMN07324.1 hypothetical protein QYS48_28500 [Marivirga sp. ABR2-2]
MKRLLIIVSLTVISQFSFAQSDATEYVELVKKNFHQEDIREKLIDYDFTRLIIPNQDFLGFIGSKYRRIKTFYNSIQQDTVDPFKYFIKGVSVVGTNKCDFLGELEIESIHEAKRMELGVDLMYKDAGFKSQGILIANFTFKEDQSQNHVGIFSGKMIIWWLIDRHGILHINDVNNYSDNYKNNQHIGIWTEYGSSDSKVCNWGVRRIPNSGDLDIGAGEFSANPKYEDLGWKYYRSY